MFACEVFVFEFESVDGLAPCAVAPREVAALQHELRDDAMEGGALVVEGFAALPHPLLASAEGAEVGGGQGGDVVIQLELDTLGRLRADGDIEEDVGGGGGRGGGGGGSSGGEGAERVSEGGLGEGKDGAKRARGIEGKTVAGTSEHGVESRHEGGQKRREIRG